MSFVVWLQNPLCTLYKLKGELKAHIHISLYERKEGRNWVLRRFQQLRSYRDEIETQNREEIPYSSRIVPRGLSVAEGP